MTELGELLNFNYTKTRTDITYEYSIDGCSLFDVLFQVSNSPDIRVRTVSLNDLSSRSDEGNSTHTIGTIVSSHKLKEMCVENGIDVVTILARYYGKTIVISGNIISNTISVTFRKKNCLNISNIEKVLFKEFKVREVK